MLADRVIRASMTAAERQFEAPPNLVLAEILLQFALCIGKILAHRDGREVVGECEHLLALCRLPQGRADHARRTFARVLKGIDQAHSPAEFIQAAVNLCTACLAMKDQRAADRLHERIVEIVLRGPVLNEESKADWLLWAAQHSMLTGRPAEAERLVDAAAPIAASLWDRDSTFVKVAIIYYEEMGRTDKARAMVNEIVRQAPDHPAVSEIHAITGGRHR